METETEEKPLALNHVMEIIEEAHRPRGAWKWLKKNRLLLFTLLGVIAGATVGSVFRTAKLHPDTIMVISYPGELFMRMLKLVILPLIVSSLIAGTSSLNAKMNGKIAVRTFTFFVLTSTFNAIFGIMLVLFIYPGRPRDLASQTSNGTFKSISLLDSMLDVGRNIIPDNLFQATFQQVHTVYVKDTNPFTSFNGSEAPLVKTLQYRAGVNTLGLVLFSIVFGIMVANSGARGRIVAEFFEAIFEIMMRLISGTVMILTPIGVASIIAGKILSVHDLSHVMAQLAWFIVTVLIGVFIYQLVILQLIYLVMLRKNPFKFYYALLQPMLTAFACAST